MDATLVTGSTGLVGYQIVQALVRRGRPVKALVRSIDKGKALLPTQCELVQGDITDPASLRHALEGCAIVYHAAGIPEQWLPDPGKFEYVNARGTQNMLEAGLAHGVRRFIYTSTIDVFAGQAGQEFDESRLDPKPRPTYYERSKQAAERHVAAALQRGLPVISLHPAAVFGPEPAGASEIVHIIRQLEQGQLPAILPGGWALVFAPDVGEGHVLAEEQAPIGSRYILSEGHYSFADFARAALAELGSEKSPPPTIPLPVARLLARTGEWLAGLTHRPPLLAWGGFCFLQWQAIPCSEKAQHELGWKPTPLREGLRQTIAHLRRPG